MRQLPLFLTALRAALGPVVIALALLWPQGWAFGLCLSAAFLSDVFDGITARRLGVATVGLRRLDSIADSVFYISATVALWLLHEQALRARAGLLVTLALLEVLRYAYDGFKFGREASYHMWSSKLWGIFLFLGFFSLLARGQDGWLVDAAVVVGIVADLEGIAISAVLSEWRADVPSLVHALRWRKTQAASS